MLGFDVVSPPAVCQSLDKKWHYARFVRPDCDSFVLIEPYWLIYKYDTPTSRHIRQILDRADQLMDSKNKEDRNESFRIVDETRKLLKDLQKEISE